MSRRCTAVVVGCRGGRSGVLNAWVGNNGVVPRLQIEAAGTFPTTAHIPSYWQLSGSSIRISFANIPRFLFYMEDLSSLWLYASDATGWLQTVKEACFPRRAQTKVTDGSGSQRLEARTNYVAFIPMRLSCNTCPCYLLSQVRPTAESQHRDRLTGKTWAAKDFLCGCTGTASGPCLHPRG